MAVLHRVTDLEDRLCTQLFKFILPASLKNPAAPDVISRDFISGNQKWYFELKKTSRHVGAFLGLRNCTEGTIIHASFTITLLHREHFTLNEYRKRDKTVFTKEKPTDGFPDFIAITEINSRKFAQPRGEYLAEIEISDVHTIFESYVELPKNPAKELQICQQNDEYLRLESSYFYYGDAEWNVAVYPAGDRKTNQTECIVHLTRLSTLDQHCHITYTVSVGTKEMPLTSPNLSTTIDLGGYGKGFSLPIMNADMDGIKTLYALTYPRNNSLRIHVDLKSFQPVTFLKINLRSSNGSEDPAQTHFYDRENQAWMMEADMKGEFLKLTMYYVDVQHIPKKYSRYVKIGITIVPANPTLNKRKIPTSPFYNFFTQSELCEPYEIFTRVRVSELGDNGGIAIGDKLTLEMEWFNSYLLYVGEYDRLDELSDRQRAQLRKECDTLQKENQILEKQLYSYQQCISQKSESGRSLSLAVQESASIPSEKRQGFNYQNPQLNENSPSNFTERYYPATNMDKAPSQTTSTIQTTQDTRHNYGTGSMSMNQSHNVNRRNDVPISILQQSENPSLSHVAHSYQASSVPHKGHITNETTLNDIAGNVGNKIRETFAGANLY